jgi:hypothetical protein
MAPFYNIIIPYLYIGGKNAVNHDIKFDTIINCTPDVPCASYCNNFIRIPVINSSNNCKKFFNIITQTNVLEEIHTSIQNKKTVLIHCIEGMHRSCSLAACYFMKYNNMNIKDSMAFIKEKRNVAFNPKYNVFCVIEMYYNYLHPSPKDINNIEKIEKIEKKKNRKNRKNRKY